MRPDEAKTIATFLLGNLEYEIGTTAGVLAAVPATNLAYRPDSVGKTALALVRHITLEDEWFLNSVADGQFTPPPDDSDACGLMTPADAAAAYKARVPAAAARVASLNGEQLLREIDMFGFLKMPAVAFLSLMLRHSAHHRGQLSAYLRAMGGTMPSIYGPTAETSTAAAV
jgi:uncharacterized damage-inducible protein DinB